MEPKLPTCTEAIGEVMKRLLVLGLFVLGITAIGSAGQNGNNQGGNNQGQNDSVPMPEGPPFEFVYGLLGAASWGLWRYSKTRNGVGSGEYKFLATYSGSNRTTAQPEYHHF
jgi:hypothetical protein